MPGTVTHVQTLPNWLVGLFLTASWLLEIYCFDIQDSNVELWTKETYFITETLPWPTPKSRR